MVKSWHPIREIIRNLLNPAEGKPQSGEVTSLDLHQVVPGQILELSFYRTSPGEDLRPPDLVLEVLSAATETNPAHFRISIFREFGWANIDFDKFCENCKVENPPQEIWLLESGYRAVQNRKQGVVQVWGGLFGAKNFLWINNDILCQLKTVDGKEVKTIASSLEHINISPVP